MATPAAYESDGIVGDEAAREAMVDSGHRKKEWALNLWLSDWRAYLKVAVSSNQSNVHLVPLVYCN